MQMMTPNQSSTETHYFLGGEISKYQQQIVCLGFFWGSENDSISIKMIKNIW